MPPQTHRCTLFHLLTCHSCPALLFYSQSVQWGHKPPPAVSAASVLLMVSLSCLHACLCVCVCVRAACTVCGCPDITSLRFELQDVEGVREKTQKTKRDGGAKNKVKRKTKDGWKRGGWETGVIKKFLSTSALLSPACARRPRPRSSPEFHSCQGTKQH